MKPNHQTIMEYILHLSETIGGRGSCTAGERRAAEYAAEQMRRLGMQNVRMETFQGAPSTYRPFVLCFSVALLGTLLVWFFPHRLIWFVAALLNLLGVWGMLAETDLAISWVHWLMPRARSQNAVGVIAPSAPVERRIVLSAHLDSHRTPVFYSSRTWYALFVPLVGLSLASMALAAVIYFLGALSGGMWARWVGLAASSMQVFALALCLHADFTPFSQGANDNASGVGVVLALAERLAQEPLARSEVWLVFTGCEEVGAYGMRAFLEAHAGELGDQTVYVMLDQVGIGRLVYLTRDGLVRKHPTHPRALDLARGAEEALPEVKVEHRVGIAYTDALVATKRGLVALTLCAIPPAGSGQSTHWHQVSDMAEFIDSKALSDAMEFTWQVLQEYDQYG